MNTPRRIRSQRGVMLLEALIAILIFSIGILAIVGMQAVSIQNVAQAKYRTDASFLANEVIGQMWAEDRSNLATNFTYPGANSKAVNWANKVMDPATGLPGATGKNAPVIDITSTNVTPPNGSNYTLYTVKVTLYWQAPQETSPHRYDAIAYLNYCANSSC